MSAITGGFSINVSGNPRRLAARDTEAYWRKITAASGPDLNSTGKLQAIQQFAASWYDAVGWSTANLLWLFGDNLGSGVSVLPFSTGPTMSLVNGPTWTSTGVSYDGVNDRADATISDSRYGTWVTLFWIPANTVQFNSHWIAYNNAGRANGAVRQFDDGLSHLGALNTLPGNMTIMTGSPSGAVSRWLAAFAVRQATSFQGTFQNAALTASAPPTASAAIDRLRIGLRDDGFTPALPGTISRLVAYSPTIIGNSQKDAIYSALKTFAPDAALP